MNETKYVLTMNRAQAQTVIAALDFWIRMRLGQWKEVTDLCLDWKSCKIEECCRVREEAEQILLQARELVMPELRGAAHSYGVFKFDETERAFNIKKAVQSCMAWHDKPEGGITVDFDGPLAIRLKEELATCEAKEAEA